MHGTILTETDFRREAEFLKQGEIYIDKAKGITIARLHKSFKPTEEVLVIEKAKGQPMSELQSESLQSLYMKGDALVKLADLWFRKAVYETGFFHGDLHGGNLFFKADVDSRVGYLLTVIDFGNAHTLSLDQQRGFVKLGVSSLLGTEYAAAHAVREMLQLNENETPKIESLVNSSFEKATSVSERLTITIIELEQSGYKLPEAFVSFARARLFIDEALFKINEEIKNKGGKKKFNSLNTLAWSTIKQMFSHLPWNQKVLSYYFFKNLAFENCKNLKDKLSLQVPRLLQPKAR
jgi:predicted unusual protein kinase regulating ubiquinone biosynthesis (AarF/ABC1/UbiB family)